MCDISWGIWEDGKAEGKEEGARETSLKLSLMGLSENKIAEAVGFPVKTVSEWIAVRQQPSGDPLWAFICFSKSCLLHNKPGEPEDGIKQGKAEQKYEIAETFDLQIAEEPSGKLRPDDLKPAEVSIMKKEKIKHES